MDGIDISDLMSKITENPDMLKKAIETAKGLMGERDNDETHDEVAEEEEVKTRDIVERARETDGGKGSRAKSRTALLMALKPYLSESRSEKIDYIIKLMKILDIAEMGGILKNLKQ